MEGIRILAAHPDWRPDPKGTAVFFGAFDPPHPGHAQLARATLALGLAARVVVAPAGPHPGKTSYFHPAAHRARLTREFCAALVPLPVEAQTRWAESDVPTATPQIDAFFRAAYGDPAYVFGADVAARMGRWENPARVAAMRKIFFTRDGVAPDLAGMSNWVLADAGPAAIGWSSSRVRAGR